jgi:hypothetical protein
MKIHTEIEYKKTTKISFDSVEIQLYFDTSNSDEIEITIFHNNEVIELETITEKEFMNLEKAITLTNYIEDSDEIFSL